MYRRKKVLRLRENRKSVECAFSLFKEGKNALVAKNAMNCDCRDGMLRSAPVGVNSAGVGGMSSYCERENVVSLYALKVFNGPNNTYRKQLCIVTDQNEMYRQNGVSTYFLLLMTGVKNASAVSFSGRDPAGKLAVFSEGGNAIVNEDFSLTDLPLTNGTGAGCYFEHRLFVGVRPATLAFSSPEDVTDFSESTDDGGYIRFPQGDGDIVAIKAFEDKLYLFFGYGIMQLNAAGSSRDFVAKKLEYTGKKILGRTVCVCQSAIFFMAEDGLYRFDGKKTERLFHGFVKLPDAESFFESAAAWKGKALIRYETGGDWCTLAVYEDGKSCFYMSELPAMTENEGGMVLFRNERGTVCRLCEGEGLSIGEAFFRSAETDFGVKGRKTLTKLCFKGKGAFSLKVQSGGRVCERAVVFENGVAEVVLSERGERFSFEFAPANDTVIEKMTAELKILK